MAPSADWPGARDCCVERTGVVLALPRIVRWKMQVYMLVRRLRDHHSRLGEGSEVFFQGWETRVIYMYLCI